MAEAVGQSGAVSAPEVADRAALLKQRAHDLPRLRRHDGSVVRAVHGLVAAFVPALVIGAGVDAIVDPNEGSGGTETFVIALVIGVLLLPWPVWVLRRGRRAHDAYVALVAAPAGWPGAPADVPVAAKTVDDATDLAQLDVVGRRELARLRFATADLGLQARVLGGAILVGLAVVLVAASVIEGGRQAPAGVVLAVGLAVPGVVGAGGVFRRGGRAAVQRVALQRSLTARRSALGGT